MFAGVLSGEMRAGSPPAWGFWFFREDKLTWWANHGAKGTVTLWPATVFSKQVAPAPPSLFRREQIPEQ